MASDGSNPASEPRFPISAVERDTGLPKDTLRVWERRYGFPLPERDEHGERVYTQSQVEKLRTLKRLIDRGYRPSKIIGCSTGELLELIDHGLGTPDTATPEVMAVFDLLRGHQLAELRKLLSQTLMRQGLATFCLETAGPLNQQIGDAWMRGQLDVCDEHLYTEMIQGLLRGALAAIPQHGTSPRVLMTTFPNEQHGIGLLMAEAMLALEGASCISLGTQTPIGDIVLAAARQHADIVALSFSLAYPVTMAVHGLEELRTQLPGTVEIWVGGANPGLVRRGTPGVQALPDLSSIAGAVARWRLERGTA